MKVLISYQPGETKSVILVSIGGRKVIRGGNGIVDGPVDDANLQAVMNSIKIRGFGNLEEANSRLGVFNQYFCCLFHISNLCILLNT